MLLTSVQSPVTRLLQLLRRYDKSILLEQLIYNVYFLEKQPKGICKDKNLRDIKN